MSNYPVWWDTSITVYNQYEDAVTHVITWQKTHLAGAFWKYVRDSLIVGETKLESESTTCRIRENEAFLEKHLWEALPNDKMKDHFTLGVGDIIVKGIVDDEIDEYVAGKRSTDLIEKYKGKQGCIEVESVSLDIGPGRVLPHYLVRGN